MSILLVNIRMVWGRIPAKVWRLNIVIINEIWVLDGRKLETFARNQPLPLKPSPPPQKRLLYIILYQHDSLCKCQYLLEVIDNNFGIEYGYYRYYILRVRTIGWISYSEKLMVHWRRLKTLNFSYEWRDS